MCRPGSGLAAFSYARRGRARRIPVDCSTDARRTVERPWYAVRFDEFRLNGGIS